MKTKPLSLALSMVALIALPAVAEDDDYTMTIMAPRRAGTVDMPMGGARIEKFTIEYDGDFALIRAKYKPTLRQRIAKKLRPAKTAAKKVSKGAKRAVQSTAETVSHGAKAVGHGVVVANEKLKPVTAVVSTIATWAGAWYFLKGRGVI